MKLVTLTLTIVLAWTTSLRSEIYNPELSETGDFHHLSGKNDDGQIEDLFLKRNSIIRVSLEQDEIKVDKSHDRKIWIAYIVTSELEGELREASGSDNQGIAGASSNRFFRLIFKDRSDAIKLLKVLLSDEKQAEQGSAHQSTTRSESKSEW